MTQIVPGRKTVDNDRSIVVFVIGARINKWWLLPFALPILSKMQAMHKELLADPESGLLGIQNLGSAELQYWRSKEHLLRYAGNRTREHQPAAKRFYQKIFDNRAIGVWHETYVVPAGHFEALYINSPQSGLGKVLPLLDAKDEHATARQRLRAAPASRTGT